MKHDKRSFSSAVAYYKKKLGKRRNVAVFLDLDKNAFFSIAPLSKAIHELGGNLFVNASYDQTIGEILHRIWENNSSGSIRAFVKEAKIRELKALFKRPDIVLQSTKNGFVGDLELDYKIGWRLGRKNDKLLDTCGIVWKEVFDVKPEERVAIRFELVPKGRIELDDYLDNFEIAYGMVESLPAGSLTVRSSTSRESTNDAPEQVSELLATLLGCELSKWSKELVFKAYREVSKELGLNELIPPDVVFGISGKGYHGKHFFGHKIGYPCPGNKCRWESPGAMNYKFDWFPQTAKDKRLPRTRIGFTQTIPIEEFIATCHIDWKKMRQKNRAVEKVMRKCDLIKVRGRKTKYGRTEFSVFYRRPGGKLRGIKRSDSDARHIVNPNIKDVTAGMMANIPGGECFLTPERVVGRAIGDVVIAIDDSYPLETPLIIEMDGNYKVVTGPRKVIDTLEKHKKDAWKRLLEQKRSKTLPPELVQMKMDNFNKIGEFAVNTNESAKLSRYLIVNEKIANMIHIALGSGFDPDTATQYHYDLVINSPKQKLDVTGYDSRGRAYPIIVKGKFVLG